MADQAQSKQAAPISSEINSAVRWLMERLMRKESFYPISSRGSCIVCGARRFDDDPTGVTCGDAFCLAELGQRIKDLEESSNEAGQNLDLLKKETERARVPITGNTFEECVDDVIEQLQEEGIMHESILQFAESLGLDIRDKDIPAICGMIEGEIENLKAISRRLKVVMG